MALDDDLDDQDQSEAFDETLTDGTDTAGSDALDLRPDVYDVTSATGDEDVDDDIDDALDADEIDDERLATLQDDSEEDDLDDDNSDEGPLSVDNLRDFTADLDAEEPGEDEVSAHGADEADVIAMGDINDLANLSDGHTMSEVEPDDVSDEDLKTLGYASEGKD